MRLISGHPRCAAWKSDRLKGSLRILLFVAHDTQSSSWALSVAANVSCFETPLVPMVFSVKMNSRLNRSYSVEDTRAVKSLSFVLLLTWPAHLMGPPTHIDDGVLLMQSQLKDRVLGALVLSRPRINLVDIQEANLGQDLHPPLRPCLAEPVSGLDKLEDGGSRGGGAWGRAVDAHRS